MKFKIIAAIVVVIVVLVALFIGTAIRNSGEPVEGQTTESIQ